MSSDLTPLQHGDRERHSLLLVISDDYGALGMSSRNPERPTPRRRVLARPPPVRSTSSPSEATTSTSAATEPTTGGSFLFSSLSGVWASLKAAAALEVGGFVKALNGGGAEGEAGVRPALGDKRGRTGEATEESSAGSQGSNARTKRRKIRTDDDSDLVFDGGEPGVMTRGPAAL